MEKILDIKISKNLAKNSKKLSPGNERMLPICQAQKTGVENVWLGDNPVTILMSLKS